MGEIRNLNEEDVEELKAKLMEMHTKNPDIESRFFDQENEPSREELMTELISLGARLRAMEIKFDRVFADFVIMDGKFVQIKP